MPARPAVAHARRRLLLALGAASLAAPAPRAQPAPGKVWRIGIVSTNPAPFMATRVDALRVALRARGYVDGRNLVIDFRSAEGSDERVAQIAAEFVRQNVDLIVTHGLAPIAVKRATTTIPVVITDSGDLVAMGVVQSLARPGGNITGQIFFAGEIAAKRVELLRDAMLRLNHLGVLTAAVPAAANTVPNSIVARAASLKLKATEFEVKAGETDFVPVFAAMAKQQVQAVAFADHPTLASASDAIAREAAKHKIASAGGPLFAQAGGLMGYGVRFPELWTSAAVFIDRIFKGANPGEIPIEQPKKFEFVVNLAAARAIGVRVPQEVLARADRLIE